MRSARVSWLFIIFSLLTPLSAYSFEYHQNMIVHKGAIISQLNNCGVHRVDNLTLPINGYDPYLAQNMVNQLGAGNSVNFTGFFRGMTNSEPRVNAGDIARFSTFGEGVVSWSANGDVYYSPTGRNLDGGDKSTLLMNIYHPNIKNMATYKGSVILRGEGSAAKYNYLTVIDNALQANRTMRRHTINGIAFIGAYEGGIYVQHNDGRIGFSTSLDALNDVFSMPIVAPAGSPRIDQIIDYKGGVLFVASNGVYASQNPKEIFSGAQVEKLLDQNPGITSVASYGGLEHADIHTVTLDKYKNETHSSRETRVSKVEKEGSLGLLVALKSGYIYHSLDGKNLLGGGATVRVAGPVDTQALTEAFTFHQQRVSELNAPWGGTPEVKKGDVKVKVFLANQGNSITLINRDWSFGTPGAQYVASGLAFDFAGNPATLNVYNKGWSGFEYKWRYKQTAEGVFSQTTKQNVIGDDGVLVRPTSGCAIIVAVTSNLIPDENYQPNSIIQFGVGSNGMDWNFILNGVSACKLMITKVKDAVRKGIDPSGDALTLFEVLAGIGQTYFDGRQLQRWPDGELKLDDNGEVKLGGSRIDEYCTVNF